MMTRSMRVMFLTLIAALLMGYLQLRSRNDSLAIPPSATGLPTVAK